MKLLNIYNNVFLGGTMQTWRRTVEGASKVLLEKHYNTHRRLISDIVWFSKLLDEAEISFLPLPLYTSLIPSCFFLLF